MTVRAPRKILYLQSTSEISGSDISLLRIVSALDRTRFEPYAILPAEGPLVGELKRLGCQVHIVSEMRKLTTRRGRAYFVWYALNYPRAIWRINDIIRREKIDLVHTNTLHNMYGFVAARTTGRPHVWHVREIVWQSILLQRVEVFLASRFADRIVVTSDAVRGMFTRTDGSTPTHLRQIPNGINVEVFNPRNSGRRIRNDQGIPDEDPVVGLVCRLDYWKGVDVFLHAAAVCGKTCPRARYLIVGGSIEGQEEYAQRMTRLAHDLGLGDVVHFSGWQYGPGDMPDVHAALDVLVLASRRPEPFGLVLLEAMATARPVVATRHGGPVTICVDGETGILVPPEDADQMGAAISTLLTHPDRARAMGSAGRRRVEELFDLRRSVWMLEDVYDEVLGA